MLERLSERWNGEERDESIMECTIIDYMRNQSYDPQTVGIPSVEKWE